MSPSHEIEQFLLAPQLLQNALDELEHESDRHTWFESATSWIPESDLVQAERLLAVLESCQPDGTLGMNQLLGRTLQMLWVRQREQHDSPLPPESIVNTYHHLNGIPARHFLLGALTRQADADSLETFAEAILTDPPESTNAVSLAFSGLFQQSLDQTDTLFPRLLAGIEDPRVATPILDYANYLYRENLVETHPANDECARLCALLTALTSELNRLEQFPEQVSPNEAQQLSERVASCVEIATSLCDALGLIGNDIAIGKLRPVMELKHRRLRVEAAAALARFGDKDGELSLLEMAREPVLRRRVLAYAEELGVQHDVPDEYQTAQALAESDICLCLAQPEMMGVPPTSLELWDEREIYWPGFDDEVPCFLFRFTYELGTGGYANVGITGPLTQAVTTDLLALSVEDAYAYFAGWQAEHEDIYEIEAGHLTNEHLRELQRLERHAAGQGFQAMELVTMGMFFGERAWVGHATQDQKAGTLVVAPQDILWFPHTSSRSIGPFEAYQVYKGRKLLRSFNDGRDDSETST